MVLLRGTAALFALTMLTPHLAEADSRCGRENGRYNSGRYVSDRNHRADGYQRNGYNRTNRYDRDERYRRDTRREYREGSRGYREERSVGESVAIVGGSAGAGAAIGGLAAGGKGAALGAAIGGTAGFIYDRQTRNNRRR